MARITKIAFWAVLFVSCVCLALTTFLGAAAIRFFFKEGFALAGRGPLEIAAVLGLVLQPFVVLFLIVRATRLQNTGRSLRIIARAFYPLFPIVLLPIWFDAARYLDSQFEKRRAIRWSVSGITYVCRTHAPSTDGKHGTARPPMLRLTEYRHSGRPGTWIVAWPGKTPIKVESFAVRTGSIGGSQGIRWREPDGRHMVAVLSFSDLVSELGPLGLWGEMAEGDTAAGLSPPRAMPSTGFDCGPAPEDL